MGRTAPALAVVSLCALFACLGAEGTAPSESGQNGLELARAVAASDARLQSFLEPSADGFRRERDAGDGERIVSPGWRGSRDKRFDLLGVRAPDTADGAVEVGVSRFENMRVRVALVDAAARPAVLEGEHVLYTNVLRDVDRVLAVSGTELEELLLLRSDAAPRELAWAVALPKGIARVASVASGLEFRDARGRAVLSMPRPYAVDARGTRRELALRWDESASTMRIAVDTAGLAWPILVDPSYTAIAWRRGPIPGEAAGPMLYDVARGQLVLYNGTSTWLGDGSTWDTIEPAVSPAAQWGFAMAYDAQRKQVVMSGGRPGPLSYPNDTWVWDGVAWTQMISAQTPPLAGSASMTFDPVGKRVIQQSTPYFEPSPQTWSWDGAAWTLLTDNAPEGTVVFDDKTQRLLLFALDASQIWAWNGMTWAPVASAHAPPVGTGGVLVANPIKKEIALFRGTDFTDLWVWDGVDWSARPTDPPPSAKGGPFAVFDAMRARYVFFGAAGDAVWAWDGTTWTQLSSAQPRYAVGMTFDTARKKTALYDGDTLWLWDGTAWAAQTTPVKPSCTYDCALAFDEANSQAVLFGGGPGPIDDTWIWDGATWTNALPAHRPPARLRASLVFDRARGRILLFGGSTFGPIGDHLFSDTWSWDGSDWTELNPAQSPTPRDQASAAYQPDTQRVVLFGGRGAVASAPLRDTWAWDGSSWQQLKTAGGPPPVNVTAMAFDDVRRSIVLLSGGGTWLLGGSTWTQAETLRSPSSTSMAFDGARRELVVFGKQFEERAMWRGYTLGGTCAAASDCPGAHCVDGVCCESTSCGTCMTCAGTLPGQCSLVLNAEDADTCGVSEGKSCDAIGVCKAAVGVAVTRAEDCASGLVADGVCCNERCDGPCQACRAELKESGDRSGICGNTKNGLDPGDSCAASEVATCGLDGTCDGRGRCRNYLQGTPCAEGLASGDSALRRQCDGLGQCRTQPQDALCSSDGHSLVRSSDGTPAGDCAPFRCASGACLTKCNSTAEACVPPALCDFDGECRLPYAAQVFAGCALGSRPTGVGACAFALACAAAAAFRRRVTRLRRES